MNKKIHEKAREKQLFFTIKEIMLSPIEVGKQFLSKAAKFNRKCRPPNSPFPSLHCFYKMNTTTTMQRESALGNKVKRFWVIKK